MWHHQLNGHGWTPGVGDGQGGLVYCGSWGCKELDTTEGLKQTELMKAKKTYLHSAKGNELERDPIDINLGKNNYTA